MLAERAKIMDETSEESGRGHAPTYPTGISKAIAEVTRLIRQVANHESNVLILGDSGTGKEVVARAIHHGSSRRNRPFVAVNCGAIPADLLESELFGHEKGAFTGAIASRKGRFEIADGGTLFLDEIGELPPALQAKLLRVLQERVFERVGSHHPIRSNVRIIAATHRNLEEAIKVGGFREDLYYRLNVFPIEMPALSARIEDLPLLVQDFVESNLAAGRGRVQLSNAALDCLKRHSWPGNVRELGNLIERLSIVSGGYVVKATDLPPRYRPSDWSAAEDEALLELADAQAPVSEAQPSAISEREALQLLEPEPTESSATHLPDDGLDLRAHLHAIEGALIRQALERSNGTVAHAARLLNLRRTTLVEKLRKFDLAVDEAASEV